MHQLSCVGQDIDYKEHSDDNGGDDSDQADHDGSGQGDQIDASSHPNQSSQSTSAPNATTDPTDANTCDGGTGKDTSKDKGQDCWGRFIRSGSSL